jgi:thiol-disulfide isomerase/thioredoxin
VVGAWVQPGGQYAISVQFTKTDDAGRFTVRDLQAGIVSFSFNYGEFIADGRFLAERDPEAVTVKLRPLPKPNQPVVAGANAAKDIGLKPLAVGTPAPEWMTGTWSDGQTRKLADYRGKVIFLDFWGIWCGPCLHQLPTVEKLRNKYEPQGVVFLSLHTPGEADKTIRRLLDSKKVSLVFALDRDRQKDDNNRNGTTAERYGVNGYPTVVLIDRAGKIAFRSDDPDTLAPFQGIMKDLGLDPKTATEEQASQVIERFLDRSIEKVLLAR